jgi:hypothetical protein
VTVDCVTVPEGGYVVVHGGRYVFDGRPDPLGVSTYLGPGTHRDVSVQLPPDRILPGVTGRVAAVLYHDDGDGRFTRFDEGGGVDRPYRVDGEVVAETVTVERTSRPTTTDSPSATATTTATARSAVSPTEAQGQPSLDPLHLIGLLCGGLFTVAAVVVLVTGRRGGSR